MSTDPVHMDFEEPGYVPAETPKKKRRGKKPDDEDGKKSPVIPQLPNRDVIVKDGGKNGVSYRDRAAANLKLDGASYVEIADTLEFESPEDAKRVVERTLALTHSPDEYDTLRLVTAARAEKLLGQSLAMASATHLVDPETGEHHPNLDRLAWHRQASVDLMNHAIITGAKAPTKVEITADEERLATLVDRLVKAQGIEDIVDADVLDIGELEQLTDDLGE